MNTIKENSKAAFNQQAATYDKDIKGQHARSLYPVLLEKLSHIPFHSALDLGCGTGEMLKLIFLFIVIVDRSTELLEFIHIFPALLRRIGAICINSVQCPVTSIFPTMRSIAINEKSDSSRAGIASKGICSASVCSFALPFFNLSQL